MEEDGEEPVWDGREKIVSVETVETSGDVHMKSGSGGAGHQRQEDWEDEGLRRALDESDLGLSIGSGGGHEEEGGGGVSEGIERASFALDNIMVIRRHKKRTTLIPPNFELTFFSGRL